MSKKYIAAGSVNKMEEAFKNRIEQLENGDINSAVNIMDTDILADDDEDWDEEDEQEYYYPDPDLNDYEELLKQFGVSEEAIDLVENINGRSIDTLNDISRCMFGEDIETLNIVPW